MDTNKDEKLSLDEFAAEYRKIDPNSSDDEIEAMFAEADKDGNGALDLGEVSWECRHSARTSCSLGGTLSLTQTDCLVG